MQIDLWLEETVIALPGLDPNLEIISIARNSCYLKFFSNIYLYNLFSIVANLETKK